MSEFEVGSRVRIIEARNCFTGLVGRIKIKSDEAFDWIIEFNDGQSGLYDEECLELVEAGFDTLLVEDIIIDEGGSRARVLEVGRTSFLRSRWMFFNDAAGLCTFVKAKELGWKVKGQPEEKMIKLSDGTEVSEVIILGFLKGND